MNAFHILCLSSVRRRGIDINGSMVGSLEDEPFSPLAFCFIIDGPTLMASFSLFYYCSWNPTCRLATIFFSSTSSMIDGMIDSVSHCLVHSTLNASSNLNMISWTWGQTAVFFFANRGIGLEVAQEVEPGAWCKVPSWRFFSRASRWDCLTSVSVRRATSLKGMSFNAKCSPDTRVDGTKWGRRRITNGLA